MCSMCSVCVSRCMMLHDVACSTRFLRDSPVQPNYCIMCIPFPHQKNDRHRRSQTSNMSNVSNAFYFHPTLKPYWDIGSNMALTKTIFLDWCQSTRKPHICSSPSYPGFNLKCKLLDTAERQKLNYIYIYTYIYQEPGSEGVNELDSRFLIPQP